jgi:hypothetical protein
MKPSRLQYFVAQGWPIRVFFAPWLIGVPLLFAYVAFTLFIRTFEPLSAWWNLAQFVFYVAISFLLGLLVGLVAASCVSPLIWLILRLCGRANGAPFRAGDMVRILDGAHRDQIGRVVNGTDGNSVKVEVQHESGGSRPESFCDFQLVKATNAEPGAVANGGPAPFGNAGVAEGPPSAS